VLFAIDTADPSGITPEAPEVTVPVEIVVAPVYVFAPDNVRVPAPIFVRPFDEPDDSAMTPETVPSTEVLTPILVVASRVIAPLKVAFAEKYTAPAETPLPDSVKGSAEVSVPTPATSSVAPLATTVFTDESPRAEFEVIFSVPAETVEAPR
jgi:hypothetical protein